MPPEQAIGAVDQVDARSDVFGLGAILCAILTGRPPFLGADSESTRQLAARAKPAARRALVAAGRTSRMSNPVAGYEVFPPARGSVAAPAGVGRRPGDTGTRSSTPRQWGHRVGPVPVHSKTRSTHVFFGPGAGRSAFPTAGRTPCRPTWGR
jgi:serine/threonine protein kinase